MTEKEYRAISDAIAECWADYIAKGGRSLEVQRHHSDMVWALANKFENEDSTFDHGRFVEACDPGRVFQY